MLPTTARNMSNKKRLPEHVISLSKPGFETENEDMKVTVRDELETPRDIPTSHADLAMTTDERAMNRQVSRKMDIAMLPLLSSLYLFNGIDRTNVGNAQTQGQYFTSVT